MAIIRESDIKLQEAICKALNIEPSVTQSIFIDMQAGDLVRLHIDQVLCRETGEKIKRIFELATWEERE